MLLVTTKSFTIVLSLRFIPLYTHDLHVIPNRLPACRWPGQCGSLHRVIHDGPFLKHPSVKKSCPIKRANDAFQEPVPQKMCAKKLSNCWPIKRRQPTSFTLSMSDPQSLIPYNSSEVVTVFSYHRACDHFFDFFYRDQYSGWQTGTHRRLTEAAFFQPFPG